MIFLYGFIFFICLSILEYFIIKFEIWQNKELFYDLHFNQIEKELKRIEEGSYVRKNIK